MRVAVVAIVFVLLASVGIAYGALRTRPQPATNTTTSFPVASTTSETPATPSPATTSTYGTEVTLALGQSATFSDGFSLTPSSVVEDSRCPLGVMCIQAGTVRVDLALAVSGTTQHQTLGIGKSVTVNGRTVTLTSVSPTKRIDTTIASGDYRFTFTVTKAAPVSSAKCYIGGCSGEICSDTPDMASNCMYRPEFACYKQATCERQTNGQCSWTQTSALTSCIASAR